MAEELQTPWRSVEAMHWKMGHEEMANRAGVKPFNLEEETAQGIQHRSSPSKGHGHSPSQGSGPSHAMYSPRYQRTPGPPPGPPGHAPGAIPPPPHATYPPPISGDGSLRGRGDHVQATMPEVARRGIIPPNHPHYQHHLRPPSRDEAYGMPGPGLPPLQPGGAPGQSRGGMLPGVAELTTGVSMYSAPAYSRSVPSAGSAASGTGSPGSASGRHNLSSLSAYRQLSPAVPPYHQEQYRSPAQRYQQQHYEPAPSGSAAGKRRASPEVMARETSRRRHLDPQPPQQQYDDVESSGRYLDPRPRQQQYEEGDSSGSHRTL